MKQKESHIRVLWYRLKWKLGLISGERYRQQYNKWKFAKDLFEIAGGRVNVLAHRDYSLIAEEIACVLHIYGYKSDVLYSFGKGADRKAFYIVIMPGMDLKCLPKRYIAFNVCHAADSFTPQYLAALNGAYGVLDDSQLNITYLREQEIRPGFLYYAALAPVLIPVSEYEQKVTPILIFGDSTSPRCKAMLEQISKKFSVKMLNHLVADEKQEELSKAKLVLNIHSCEKSRLEALRICEALSHGCMVISEAGENEAVYPHLQEMVEFVAAGDVDSMLERIEYWMTHDEELRRKMETNRHCVAKVAGRFRMFIARMLLSYNLIDLDAFYEKEHSVFSLGDGKICISLPESPERGEWFDRQNKYGFRFFPGLRHAQGWKGCAMSYKFLARLALDENRKHVTICEDDAELPEDFADRYAEICQYMEQSDADAFSGFLVEMNDSANILSVDQSRFNGKIVQTDTIISTVFTVYKEKFLRILASWNERDDNVAMNAIDRYMSRQGKYKVAFSWPFLVNHCENLFSTIWKFQNDFYTERLTKTKDVIDNKIKEYTSGTNNQ